jgi:hypothetical protein
VLHKPVNGALIAEALVNLLEPTWLNAEGKMA